MNIFNDINSAWKIFYSEIVNGDDESNHLLLNAKAKNPWFTPSFSKAAIQSANEWFLNNNLVSFCKRNPDNCIPNSEKKIGIIAAGNIPAVGLHDLLCALLSNTSIHFKPATSDSVLIPRFIEILHQQNDYWRSRVQLVDQLRGDFSAFIGTGSNNTNRYFKEKFSNIPSLLRHHRNSIAIIDQNDTEADFNALAHDVFQYFGMGCRNVSLVFIPKDFDLNRMINAFFSQYPWLIDFARYADAVKYYRSYFGLTIEPFWDAGFLLMREGERLDAPIGCLNVVRYSDVQSIQNFVSQNQQNIQCIVSNKNNTIGNTVFGRTQNPHFLDFADGINTLNFINNEC